MPVMQVTDTAPELERALRMALAATRLETPRPVINLELPLRLDKLIGPRMLASLRPAAVLAPVVRRGTALSMVFTVRSAHLRSHGGQISFPGGGRDPGDNDAIGTALREAREEIGLDPTQVEVVGYLDDYPTLTRYLITPIVGVIDGDPRWQLDENEVAEVFEVPLSLVLDPRSYERKHFSRDGLNLPFFELNWERHRIWGATAGMLWNLAQKFERHRSGT